MTFKNFILKLTSRSGNALPQVQRSFEAKNLFHWRVLLIAFFVMTALVLTTSFFVHQDIGRGEFSPVTKIAVPGSGQVTSERLEKLIGYFEIKSVTFEQVRKNRTVTVDPSR